MNDAERIIKLIDKTYLALKNQIDLNDYKTNTRLAHLESIIGRPSWEHDNFEQMSVFVEDDIKARTQMTRLKNQLKKRGLIE